MAWWRDLPQKVAACCFFLVVITLPLRVQWPIQRFQVGYIYAEYTSLIFYLSDTAVLLFLAAVGGWYAWKRPVLPPPPRFLIIPLTLLPILSLVSGYWAAAPLLTLYTAIRLLVLLGLVVAVWAFRPSHTLVAVSVAASLVCQSLIAIKQFVEQDDLGWRVAGEMPLSLAPGTNLSLIPVGDSLWLRGYGLTPHPNILGGILVAFLLVLVVTYLQSQGWHKLIWLELLLIGAAGLAVSFSRSAWLGAAVGGGLLVFGGLWQKEWRQKYGRFLFPLVILAGVAALVFAISQRDLLLARLVPPASYVETRSLDERGALNAVARYFVQQHPFLGVGASNFSVAFHLLGQPLESQLTAGASFTIHPAHNIPLLLTSELGILGGGLWVYLMVAPVVAAWRLLKAGKLTLWGLGITAVLITLAITDLFDFYAWGWPQGRLLRWLFFALFSTLFYEDTMFAKKEMERG